MTHNKLDALLEELKPLAAQFVHIMDMESNAIRAAKFAHAIALQDQKMMLHKAIFSLLENAKTIEKTDAQRDVLKSIVLSLKNSASENKASLEGGFSAIERIVSRILGVMKRSVQKEAPNYTSRGALYNNPHKTLAFQTDRMA